MADDVVETPDVDDTPAESLREPLDSHPIFTGGPPRLPVEPLAAAPVVAPVAGFAFPDPIAGTHQPAPRRRSRFDRPKEPHDWHWALGIVGRTLISLGILMFAFVAYQLWGTGIQTALEQDRLGDRFDEMLETTVPLTVPSDTAPLTSTPVATQSPATTVEPATSDAPAPSTTTTVVPSTAALPAVITAPPEGDPVARLNIPAMDLKDWEVIEGVSPADLHDGPGHFPETPLPGQLGNSAIAGHRTTHGAPFGRIDDLEAGDDVIITTLAGQYTYVVTGKTVVDPGDYAQVIPTLDATKATLTLTSCHPAYSTKHRLVVFAELDLARSSPVTSPPADLGDRDPSTLPTETRLSDTGPAETVATTLSTDTGPTDTGSTETGSTETGPNETVSEPATTQPATASPATTVTASTVAPAVTEVDPPDESQDVFANRWFGDSGAFPQVALWGFALIAVSLAACAISRRARRNWVGALVGFAPFVVVLYYFFENVNRLLPPNL